MGRVELPCRELELGVGDTEREKETLLLDVILPRVDDLILCKFVPLMKGPPNLIHGFAIKMPLFRCHLLDIETALLCHKRSHNMR